MVPQNSHPPNDDSGLSVSLRLSGALIASILGVSISFGSGYVLANVSNKQIQTQTQNVNCPGQNSTVEHP